MPKFSSDQIHDSAIFDRHIAPDAAISHSKLNISWKIPQESLPASPSIGDAIIVSGRLHIGTSSGWLKNTILEDLDINSFLGQTNTDHLPEGPVNKYFVNHGNEHHNQLYITADVVNFSTLNTNAAVGTAANQVASGNHTHTNVYQPYDTSIMNFINGSHARVDATATTISTINGNVIINGIESTVYSHPIGDGNLHIPATGNNSMGMVLIAGNTPGAVSWGFVSANTVGAATINHTHPDATESTDGFMSSVDKIKLDAILINIPAITEGIEGYVLSIDNSQQVVWTAFTAASIGLSFVDNTADMDKPISTATIIGLQAKANTVHTHVSNDVSDATSVLNSDNIVKRDSTGSFEAYNVILHNNINISGTCTAQSVRGGFGGGFAAFYPIANTLNLEYGKCYIIDSNNNASLSSKYMDDGIVGIISDTADYISGSETQALPIITSGFTLASVDQVYPPGTPLTCGIDGVLVKIEDVDKVQFPEKIIATFIRGETETLWNNISVNGRHWVKI